MNWNKRIPDPPNLPELPNETKVYHLLNVEIDSRDDSIVTLKVNGHPFRCIECDCNLFVRNGRDGFACNECGTLYIKAEIDQTVNLRDKINRQRIYDLAMMLNGTEVINVEPADDSEALFALVIRRPKDGKLFRLFIYAEDNGWRFDYDDGTIYEPPDTCGYCGGSNFESLAHGRYICLNCGVMIE